MTKSKKSKEEVRKVEKAEKKEKEELSLEKQEAAWRLAPVHSHLKFAEEVILTVLSYNIHGHSEPFNVATLTRLIFLAREIFQAQGRMIECDGPVNICGDIHAQFPDLIRLFSAVGFPPHENYLFLGDYVDRGNYNLETIVLCFALKVRYPHNFFMLRGNHELSHVNERYGFRDEIFNRIGGQDSDNIYNQFANAFHHMPLTALVGGKILCMHGGLSKSLERLEQLRHTSCTIGADEDTLEVDLLWADPAAIVGWDKNPRGASFLFGEQEVVAACKRLGIDMIVRGHQVVQDGYEFFAGRKLVTVFSAPHFMKSFDNSAAVCKVSADLEISFHVLKPGKVNAEEREIGGSAE